MKLYSHPSLPCYWIGVSGGEVWRIAATPTGTPRTSVPGLARLLPYSTRLAPAAERVLLGTMRLSNADWLDLLLEEARGRLGLPSNG
jgi:hypothetical protein